MHNHYEVVIDNNRIISAAWRIRNISLQALYVRRAKCHVHWIIIIYLVTTYSRNDHHK